VKRLPCNKKMVLFGELMMRLSTKRNERIVQAREFEVIYGGAEANLGVALTSFGVDSYMVSSVPDRPTRRRGKAACGRRQGGP
jgi:2-dehydro-3-deoxygluconokinase